MDLNVAVRLRAQTEGASAIKQMREETSDLAAALKEVRAAAQSGGRVSAGAIKTLGGFDEFQKAFVQAQRELVGGAASTPAGVPVDAEKAFRARLRLTNEMAKVRARSAEQASAAELKADAAVRKEAEETFRFRQRMNEQQRREAQETADTEARAAREAARAQMEADREAAREAEETFRFRQRMTRQQADEALAEERRLARERAAFLGPVRHGRGRGVFGELGIAAEYTLAYGAVNEALRGVAALARSPFDIGRMTLGVADEARQIEELAKQTRMSTSAVQELQYAFAMKGVDAEKLPQMLDFMAKSEVAAARGIRNSAVAFKALGVAVRDTRGHLVPMDRLLYETVGALDKLHGGSKATALSMMIFGRGAKEYMPVIQDIRSLRAMAAEAENTGYVLGPDQLGGLQRLDEQYRHFQLQIETLKRTVAVAAMPIVSDLLRGSSDYLTKHHAEIAAEIKEDFQELRKDVPVILAGMTEFSKDMLATARAVREIVHDLNQNKDLIKGLTGATVAVSRAGSGDLPKAASAGGGAWTNIEHAVTRHAADLARSWTHPGAHPAAEHPRVTVTVQALPGTSVRSVETRGSVEASVRRGPVGVG